MLLLLLLPSVMTMVTMMWRWRLMMDERARRTSLTRTAWAPLWRWCRRKTGLLSVDGGGGSGVGAGWEQKKRLVVLQPTMVRSLWDRAPELLIAVVVVVTMISRTRQCSCCRGGRFGSCYAVCDASHKQKNPRCRQ